MVSYTYVCIGLVALPDLGKTLGGRTMNGMAMVSIKVNQLNVVLELQLRTSFNDFPNTSQYCQLTPEWAELTFRSNI